MKIAKFVFFMATIFAYRLTYCMWEMPDPLADCKESKEARRRAVCDQDGDILLHTGLQAIELSYQPCTDELEQEFAPTEIRKIGMRMIRHAAKAYNNVNAHCALWYLQKNGIIQCHKKTRAYAGSFVSRSEFPPSDFYLGLRGMVEKVEALKQQAADEAHDVTAVIRVDDKVETCSRRECLRRFVQMYEREKLKKTNRKGAGDA